MMQFAIVGVSAGAAAALLFASVTSGVWLSIPLFYLAPLPILIAGLGWTHWAALIAAATGALALGIVFGAVFLFAFLAGAGIPAWWLGYLAMLARPGAPNTTNGQSGTALEWYPPGRLVIWAALLAAFVVLVAIPNFGADAESFRAGLRGALATILRAETGTPADAPVNFPGVTNIDRLIDFLVNVIPPAAAVLATITNLFNLWLAARVVKFSGTLARPWPQLSTITFPPMVMAALATAIVLSFVDGMLGIVAGVFSAESSAGLRCPRLCSAAHHYAGHEYSHACAQSRLCGGDFARLANFGALSAWTSRHRYRLAWAHRAQTRTACPFMRSKLSPTTKVQIEE